MLQRLRRSASQQFAAVALVFALMLQGMAVAAAAGSSIITDAGADPNRPSFQICQHNSAAKIESNADAGDAAAPGSAPERAGSHCVFCLAATVYALEAPLPDSDFHVVLRAIAPWHFTAWRLPALTVDASTRPRGPPLPA